ncbi:RHD3-domain-containing protein [Athelia psychrophila]|uniref:RHD3-domain-containing protein n=1 Tax=Athelia psychrophila TaxID=1759441 RepID=A0A166ADT4_9AGAM|nr:RHD3-domain-containing protein [Fibularhizoctonia sp. CBS 109695]
MWSNVIARWANRLSARLAEGGTGGHRKERNAWSWRPLSDINFALGWVAESIFKHSSSGTPAAGLQLEVSCHRVGGTATGRFPAPLHQNEKIESSKHQSQYYSNYYAKPFLRHPLADVSFSQGGAGDWFFMLAVLRHSDSLQDHDHCTAWDYENAYGVIPVGQPGTCKALNVIVDHRSALTTSDEDFNLDPMSFDSIVHTERPTMPEPVEDARDRVHLHTHQEDWMRLQAGEQQRYIPEATSNSAPEAIDRHARFFLPAGNIYFSIENTLYSVPRAPFETHSSTALTGKGLTEDDPLILDGVKATHFDHLLSILYPSSLSRSEHGSAVYTASTVDDWTAILHLAVRWGFQSIRTLAIARLTPIATDIDKIVLGRQYGINAWLHEAFTAICMREQSVTKEESRRMKVDDIIEISALRQLFRPVAQPTQLSTLSIGEACAGFDLLQFVSLPEPAIPPVSEEAGSAEKSQEAAALFLEQLELVRTSCLAQFNKETLDGLKGDNYCFANVVANARKRCEKRFKTSALKAILGTSGWTWDDEMNMLSDEVTTFVDQCRRDETKKMLDLIERNFKEQISERVASALNKADPDMWSQVLTSFNETLKKAESTYLAKAKSYNCTAEENSTALANLRKRTWLALHAKINEQTADAIILSKLRGHFEKRFRYDEHGALRVWKSQDDINGIFKKAHDQTLELLQLYSKISHVYMDKWHAYIMPPDAVALSSLDEVFDFDATLIIFTETKKLELTTMYYRDAHACYVEAKRHTVALKPSTVEVKPSAAEVKPGTVEMKPSTVAVKPSTVVVKSSTVAIPAWMYGVLVLPLLWTVNLPTNLLEQVVEQPLNPMSKPRPAHRPDHERHHNDPKTHQHLPLLLSIGWSTLSDAFVVSGYITKGGGMKRRRNARTHPPPTTLLSMPSIPSYSSTPNNQDYYRASFYANAFLHPSRGQYVTTKRPLVLAILFSAS